MQTLNAIIPDHISQDPSMADIWMVWLNIARLIIICKIVVCEGLLVLHAFANTKNIILC